MKWRLSCLPCPTQFLQKLQQILLFLLRKVLKRRCRILFSHLFPFFGESHIHCPPILFTRRVDQQSGAFSLADGFTRGPGLNAQLFCEIPLGHRAVVGKDSDDPFLASFSFHTEPAHETQSAQLGHDFFITGQLGIVLRIIKPAGSMRSGTHVPLLMHRTVRFMPVRGMIRTMVSVMRTIQVPAAMMGMVRFTVPAGAVTVMSVVFVFFLRRDGSGPGIFFAPGTVRCAQITVPAAAGAY